MEQYLVKDGKKLRFGYTTGSCSAAAAKAAATMLLTGESQSYVNLMTPKGMLLTLEVLDCTWDLKQHWVSCGIRKDAGDDPDVTDQAVIYARVRAVSEKGIFIDGGRGVGRVTKPGLDQPVGNAAINSTPRKMIQQELKQLMENMEFDGGLEVIISIPAGECLAERTFNPKLGIVGGISVLGTSGIVEPMSEKALLDTIFVEIQIKKAEGCNLLAIAPGNYGQAFMKEHYGFELDTAVKCSNFVGDSVLMAQEAGFQKVLFAGHLGKLIKVAAGAMNTHSKYGDGRMEMLDRLTEEVIQESGKERTDFLYQELDGLRQKIRECAAVDEAVFILRKVHLDKPVLLKAAGLVKGQLENLVSGQMQIEVILFSNVHGLLAETADAEDYILELNREKGM